MGMPGWQELLLIALIVILVFGAGKLPETARNIGKAFREFKSGLAQGEESEET